MSVRLFQTVAAKETMPIMIFTKFIDILPVKRGKVDQNKFEEAKTLNEVAIKPKTNVEYSKHSVYLLSCIPVLETELSTAFEKLEKPRNFEFKALIEVEKVKIKLLRYISIFRFATLGIPNDAIRHKVLLSNHSFLATKARRDIRIHALCCQLS